MGMIKSVVTRSPDETERLGVSWAKEAKAGWVIGLQADLGAGKTQLVKGIAKGLGINSRIQSPTFGLVCEYRVGARPLYDLDLYRLENEEQIRGAGLEEYFFQSSGVTVIEWVDRWPEFVQREKSLPAARYRHVVIEPMGEF